MAAAVLGGYSIDAAHSYFDVAISPYVILSNKCMHVLEITTAPLHIAIYYRRPSTATVQAEFADS